MIDVFGSDIGSAELREIEDSVQSQWLGLGSKVRRFEEAFKARLGLDHFALVDSGSNALYMAVELLDLPAGSQVIVPTFTWVACAQAVLLAGHEPVFCDVDLGTQKVSSRRATRGDTSRRRLTK